LSVRERGAPVRALAAREHLGLDGRWDVSRNTLDRWIRWYREGAPSSAWASFKNPALSAVS
jgi:transposase-like protein